MARPVVVPVSVEQMMIRKRPVTTGTVRVRKRVHERTVTLDQPLVSHRASVHRRRVNRVVDAVEPPRWHGDTLVIPVIEEVLVKRLRIVEELHVRLRRSIKRDRRAVRLRHEAVEVERGGGPPGARGRP